VLLVARDPERPRRPVPWEVGGSLNFVTGDGSPALGDRRLRFTDVVLVRTHAAATWGRRVQIFGGGDVLAKQPSTTDESVWQGALLGTRVDFGPTWSGWARAEGGPALVDAGHWLSGDAAVQHRLSLVDELFVETALGGAYTRLFSEDAAAAAPWFVEVLANLGLALRDHAGKAALWIAFDFRFPAAGAPDRDAPDATGAFIDPQTRVNFRVGGRGQVTKVVDLLPVLNAGFDQQQLVFGFMLRFGRDGSK
jgi:hypothetical protein